MHLLLRIGNQLTATFLFETGELVFINVFIATHDYHRCKTTQPLFGTIPLTFL